MDAEPDIVIRVARRDDLRAIVSMLADDPLGSQRESTEDRDLGRYRSAFEEIDADPHHRLIVAGIGDEVVGVLQLTIMPSLTYRGARRAQIEGVRVQAARRSCGIGRRLVGWAIDHARDGGCRRVQLTTDRTRPEALAFYESVGFTCSHHGLKLDLEADVADP